MNFNMNLTARRRPSLQPLVSSLLILSLATLPARADTDDAAKFVGGKGTALFVAAGVLLPLAEDNDAAHDHALRAADTLLTSVAITEGLKHVVHERRPDGTGDDSFPSGHATTAFAIATMQAKFHPKQAPLWYLGATLIAAARVKQRRHNVGDVLAGAGIGYVTAHYEMKSKHGFLLAPFIKDRREGGGRGIAFGGQF